MKKQKTLLALAVLVIATAMAAAQPDPTLVLPTTTVDGRPVYYHVVQPKETVYSLCRQLGITADSLIMANPEVRDGLKAYSTLYFPVSEKDLQTRHYSHVVKKGETVYGISRHYGLTTDQLLAQNPSARDGLKAGMKLNVAVAEAPMSGTHDATSRPLEPSVELVTSTPDIPEVEPDEPDDVTIVLPETESEPEMVMPTPAAPREAVIAVVLPFMLSEQTPSKNALRNTEFLKGMLMAVDTLSNSGSPVRLIAFDSCQSTDSVAALIASGVLNEADVIIAPDDEAQLRKLAAFAKSTGAKVINSLLVKDTLHTTNPAVVQTNISHHDMFETAVDGFLYRFPMAQPVIVSRRDGPEDRRSFIDQLKKHAEKEGRQILTIEFDSRLKASDLQDLPTDTDLAFIPVSGKQPELNRILPAIVEFKDKQLGETEIMVWGYPEWITYRGETRDRMYQAKTIVFSRFFADDDDLEIKDFDNRFEAWYGAKPDSAIPRQSLMGYDMATWIVNGLRRAPSTFPEGCQALDGLQNGFRFVPASDTGGWVSDVVYLIEYRPGAIANKILL